MDCWRCDSRRVVPTKFAASAFGKSGSSRSEKMHHDRRRAVPCEGSCRVTEDCQRFDTPSKPATTYGHDPARLSRYFSLEVQQHGDAVTRKALAPHTPYITVPKSGVVAPR
jgi:hypothetical protein